jgi:hypothetical protein
MVPVTPAFRRSRIHGRSVFRASSGRASLAQVVSLTGGIPVTRKSSDSSRMSTKNQRLRKSSTFFIHFRSMKSPSVPAVAMKETHPELWLSPEDRREKRWRKYATDGLMPIQASQA